MGYYNEIYELKVILIQEPELTEDTVKKINEARQKIRNDFVTHEEMKKEFMGH